MTEAHHDTAGGLEIPPEILPAAGSSVVLCVTRCVGDDAWLATTWKDKTKELHTLGWLQLMDVSGKDVWCCPRHVEAVRQALGPPLTSSEAPREAQDRLRNAIEAFWEGPG